MPKTGHDDNTDLAVAGTKPRTSWLAYLKKSFLATHNSEAALDLHFKARRVFGRRGKFVFVAAMPKSGSTFLTRSISRITGFEHKRMTYAFERNEQELYLPKLIDNYNRSTVTQQHTRATGPNIELFRRFRIRPVILVRNLFDVVISIRDHLLKEGAELFPSLYATRFFATLPENEQHDFVITYAIPWYFNFYTSWFDASRDNRLETLWLTYEELVSDWTTGIGNVLEFHGIDTSETEIRTTVELMQRRRRETRFNKGVVGRGHTGLTPEQRERILTMKRYYPWVDFSRVGL